MIKVGGSKDGSPTAPREPLYTLTQLTTTTTPQVVRPGVLGRLGVGSRLVWAAGEGEEGGGAGGADQFAVGSLTVVPSSRAPVIPYFFGLHSRASFWASDIWAGVILLATISRFLTD